ncbi:unnamed protein product, partial [Protopolystoma xenopodis]
FEARVRRLFDNRRRRGLLGSAGHEGRRGEDDDDDDDDDGLNDDDNESRGQWIGGVERWARVPIGASEAELDLWRHAARLSGPESPDGMAEPGRRTMLRPPRGTGGREAARRLRPRGSHGAHAARLGDRVREMRSTSRWHLPTPASTGRLFGGITTDWNT